MKFSSNKKYKFLQKVYSTSIPSNIRKLVNSSIYTIHHHLFRPTHSLKKKKKKNIKFAKSDRHSFDILRSRSGRGALKVITKALSREASPANLIPRGGEKGGRGKPLPVIRSPGLERWLGKGSSDGPELGVTRLGGCLGVN